MNTGRAAVGKDAIMRPSSTPPPPGDDFDAFVDFLFHNNAPSPSPPGGTSIGGPTSTSGIEKASDDDDDDGRATDAIARDGPNDPAPGARRGGGGYSDAGEEKDDDEYDDARRRSHPFRLTPSYLEFLGNVDKRRSTSWYCCDRSDTNSNVSAWSLSAVGRDDDDDDEIDDDARNSYTEEDAFAGRMGNAFLRGMNFDGKVVPPADVGVGGGGGGGVVGWGPYLMKYSPSYLSERSDREDDDGNASSTWSFSAVGAE